MTLLYRLLVALFGAALAVAPAATVEVVVEQERTPDQEKKDDAPEKTVRSLRPVVLKDATPRDIGLRIETEEIDDGPAPGPADDDSAAAPAPPRYPIARAPAPRTRRVPSSWPRSATRAGLLDLPPPADPSA